MSGRGAVRSLLLLGLAAAALPAGAQTAIDGTIRNGTTGLPGRADRINLLAMGGGLDTIATVANVEGKFHFDLAAAGPYMLQVQYAGVTYMHPVPPQERGIAMPEVVVYETTDDPASLAVSIPHWLVIVDGPLLHIARVFDIENLSNPTRAVVPGVFRFDLPDDAKVTAANLSSARLPLHQEPVETKDGRGKTIDYPIRGGTTRYELEHEVPYRGEATLSETLYNGARALNILVVPADVEVEAEGVTARGRKEGQGMSFLTFTGENLSPGQVVTLRIKGNARAPQPPAAGGAAGGATAGGGMAGGREEGEPKEVETAAVRGLRKAGWLGGLIGLLAAGFWVALRRPAPQAAPARRHSARAEQLLADLAAADDRRERGESSELEHAERRAALKRELLEELSGARRRKKTA